MKKSIKEFAADCKRIGIKSRRAGFAGNQLPEDEAKTAFEELEEALQNFANKYGMPVEDAKSISWIVADNCNLGLSY